MEFCINGCVTVLFNSCRDHSASLGHSGVGSIIATGIFSFLPLTYSEIAGPAVILSLLLASVTAACAAVCYCEFACELPVVGGGYACACDSLSPLQHSCFLLQTFCMCSESCLRCSQPSTSPLITSLEQCVLARAPS